MAKKDFRILIVDDSLDLANNIKDVLEIKGYFARVASSGKEAIQICKDEKFDLILLDFNLPDMDGLTIHSKLDNLVDAEFIIITGYGSLETAKEAVARKNIVGYEVKPIELNRLLSLVKQIKKRRDVENSLFELEEKYKTVVENSFEGIAIVKNDKIKFCNKSFKNIFKITNCDDRINPSFSNFISDKSKKIFDSALTKLEKKEKEIVTFDLLALTTANSEIDVELSCSRIKYGEGDAILIFVRDISDYKKLLKELYHAQKMDALGRLAGGIAHDFNNIATVLIGNAEIIMSSLNPDERVYKDVEELYRAAKRAADFTKQLLVFSRKQEIQPEIINVNDTVLEMKNMLSRIVGENINLEIDVNNHIKKIMIDKSHLEQVIMNLVINAKDAMPEGGVLKVQVANIVNKDEFSVIPVSDSRDFVVISVQDSGIGISDEIKDKIFEPFFTTKKSGKGSGLGLSIVYGIVKQYKGYIDLITAEKKGTKFNIILPVFVGDKEEYAPSNEDIIEVCKGDETILVAEDEEDVRKFIVKILGMYGYKTIEASNGKDALDICKNSQNIDLILADLLMPLFNGTKLSDRLKELNNDLKVLYMSGYAPEELSWRDMANRYNSFIQKPFTPTLLLSKIRELLDNK